MAENTHPSASRPVRDVADGYVDQLAVLNPILATMLGVPVAQDRLPDLQALPGARPASQRRSP